MLTFMWNWRTNNPCEKEIQYEFLYNDDRLAQSETLQQDCPDLFKFLAIQEASCYLTAITDFENGKTKSLPCFDHFATCPWYKTRAELREIIGCA